MPSFFAPVASQTISGQLALNAEGPNGDGLYVDTATDRVFLPGGTMLTFLLLQVTFSASASDFQSSITVENASVVLRWEAEHPAPASFGFIIDDTDEDFVLTVGSWPFMVPGGGAWLSADIDGTSGLSTAGGTNGIQIDYTPGGSQRWWAGVAGWT